MKNSFWQPLPHSFSGATYAIDDPVQYVNPLVGSHSTGGLSTGNTYPAIALPWGMNFWTPQTGKMGDGWCYTYDAEKIRGFKQTHQPSPWMNDYAMFNIMPECGDAPIYDENKRASWFSHKAEVSKPHYYKVYLADYDITTEIAPTSRAAIFRFTCAEGKNFVIVDAFDRGSYVKVIPGENKVVGYTTRNSGGVPEGFKNYFVLQFDRPFAYTSTADEGKESKNLEMQSKHAAAAVGFQTKRGEQLNVRVASSFISIEQAEQNLKELGSKSLEEVSEAGRQEWNKVLSVIDVDDNSDVDRLRTFYSCLYRSTLFPRSFYEINAKGEVVHYSPYNGQVLPGYLFADTGFWDTFRALFPAGQPDVPEHEPEDAGRLGQCLTRRAASCPNGALPATVPAWWATTRRASWPMPTSRASAATTSMPFGKPSSMAPTPTCPARPAAASSGRPTTSWAMFPTTASTRALPAPWSMPSTTGASTSSVRHWASLRRKSRSMPNTPSTTRTSSTRSHNLMRGKLANGEWAPNFNPFKWGDAFTEGNSWHYSWSVFHDPQGLIDLMGGKDVFNQMLDSVFILPPIFDDSYYGGVIHEIREMQIMNMGNYAHGNQPIQHMIYMYDYSGQPWKTQYWLRETMNRMYNAHADGYCGDEDNGQTSAWYIFTAMGFYPVCPGSGEYVLGAPYFKKMTLHLENGKDVVITAPQQSDVNRYVGSLRVNGTAYDKNYVNHTDLIDGMKMDYTMQSEPNRQRGTSAEAAPYSFSKEYKPAAAKGKKKK